MRVLALLLAALIVLPCALVTGSRLIGGAARSPVPELAAFAPWAILGWVAVLILLLIARWWWPGILVLVLLAVQLTWVLPTGAAPIEAQSAGGRPGAVTVRVLTLNAQVGRADVGEILALVAEHAIDLLALQEVEPALVEQMTAGLAGALPQVARSNPTQSRGTVLWSRWPITSIGPSLGVGAEISRSLLRVPGAVPVTVTGVHTISPGWGRIDAWNRDLESLIQASAETSGAQLMLGDFNASRDHRPFRRLLETGLVDGAEVVRALPWRAVTWPANRPPLPVLVRLDHVLVTPDSIAVRALSTVTVAGTDHRAVLAELEFQPGRSGTTPTAD